MRALLALVLLLIAPVLRAERIAYDEFDGREAGWAESGLGGWLGDGRLEGGRMVAVSGNSWRLLSKPVGGDLWVAITMRMRTPIQGYASIVPAVSVGTQISEFGFNTAYGNQKGLFRPGGPFGPVDANEVQTFLAHYDLPSQTWSGWIVAGDGLSLADRRPEPLVSDVPMSGTEIAALYLTKGSSQELEVERVAIATTARDALIPAPKGAKVVTPTPRPPVRTPNETKLLASGIRSGDRISFFGDSITWQGGYLERLGQTLRGRGVTLINRGINGGKSTDLLSGVKDLYGQTQPGFPEVLRQDRPDAVVIFIGINDVWHGPQGNPPTRYEQALRSLVREARQKRVRVVLATPTVIGEKPLGQNPHDAQLDAYAEIVRRVAREAKLPLADLRAVFRRGLGGTPRTYDGVHMLPGGNALIADTLCGALASGFAHDAGPRLNLVPYPSQVSVRNGAYRLPKAFRIETKGGLPGTAALLGQGLSRLAPVQVGKGPVAIRLSLEPGAGDGYRLQVGAKGVSLTARNPHSLAWGVSTLFQLVNADGTLPFVEIEDRPALPFRALLVDVARQWHSVATLREIIDLAFVVRLRYIQLHLTDDQSFTFPTEAFPLLPTPGRTYSRAELRDLQVYAEALGVTLIPELEMPGHAAQMVSKMPDLFRAHPRHHATLNFAKPEALAALDTMLGEVAEVFPNSPYLHIGGDEADLTFVHENPDFQAAMRREGFSDSQELFRWFIGRMNRVVKGLGRQMIVWEGFAPSGRPAIPKDVLVMAFESSYYRPDHLARDGFTLINTSWKPLYVVNQRNWTPEEIYGWNHRRWDHFVQGMPSFGGLQLGPEADIRGGMMCAWEQPETLEIPSLLDRLPAMSERLWNPSLRVPYADHARRWSQAKRVFTALQGNRGPVPRPNLSTK